MDKNSITGIVLIAAILGLFWWMNKPSEAELERQKQMRDSVARVEQMQQQEADRKAAEALRLKEEEMVATVVDSAQLAATKAAVMAYLQVLPKENKNSSLWKITW